MTDPKLKKRYIIQGALFIITIITTTLSGAELMFGKSIFFSEEHRLTFQHFFGGFHYSIPFLAFLTFHEFGHYIAARLYHIKVSLPYYIPMWLGPLTFNIGSMGAVIRLEGLTKSRKEFFDIGIAGPLAGFVVALGVLFYGFSHLPPPEHIYSIHPDFEQYGLDYPEYVYSDTSTISLTIGTNLIFEFMKKYVAPSPELVPPPQEIMHYPYLLAGYLALFFTALNLIPIGQLDGGHILYGLFGIDKSRKISAIVFVALVFYAGLGIVSPHESSEDLMLKIPFYLLFLYYAFYNIFKDLNNKIILVLGVFAIQYVITWLFPGTTGYSGWLLIAFIIGRFLGVYHPQAPIDEPLDLKRKILGWLAFIIFILCFSPTPLIIS